ncbi:MAG: ATP-binding protein [Patescibacteria group bacterium]
MSIKWKFILIFGLITFVPIFSLSFYTLNGVQEQAVNQIKQSLTLEAELAEGHILTYFEQRKDRTADWSSDGYIRSEFESILDLPADTDGESQGKIKAAQLGEYILTKKHPLDSVIITTDILDSSGTVVVSTNPIRIGHTDTSTEDLDREYEFTQAINAESGQAFVGQIISEDEVGHSPDPMFHVSAPLFSPDGSKTLGILVTHVGLRGLDDVLSGQRQIELGAKSGFKGRGQSLEIYLVNQDKLMVTRSRFVENAVLNQIVDTQAVRLCHEKGEEITGQYLDYRGVSVYGASMCPDNQWWLLLTEIDESEVLVGFLALEKQIIIFSILTAMLAALIGLLYGVRIYRRIDSNLDVLRKIGAGDLGFRTNTIARDEIGKVGRGIDSMADSIEKYISRIKEAETQNTTLIESSPDCIKLLDPKGRLLHLSKGGLREHGFKSNKETVGWNYLATIEKKHLPAIKAALKNALSGKITTFEVEHVKDKKIKGVANRDWCEMTFSPVRDAQGKVKNILVVSRDISDKKQIQEKQHELDLLKTKFITVVSHQLRTPLSAISWNLEAILGKEMGDVAKGQEEVLRLSYDATKEIITRIGDLTTAMEIEEGKMRLEKEKASLQDVLGSVCAEVLPWCERRKIKHSITLPTKPLPLTEFDPTRIRGVLHKLIDNAVSYTKEKGGIEIVLSKLRNKVRFEIKDTGIGIPKSDQAHIFERFYRASNASKMKTDASGLGLFIAKAVVEAHGGNIGFTSQEGKGSTFWFELPI